MDEYSLCFELTEILIVRHIVLRQPSQILGISLIALLLPFLVHSLDTRFWRLLMRQQTNRQLL